ncbi:ribosome maturation factor RimM [Aliterella atlantica]|uniref:Ribosome maturation factor RimM n=1 Tax=Aliterella atlantica CENA595 TaxID=1618023 RepID=A0A0D8ZWJ2_9CYAN|nr:ribosome maturation factor RimM [Aliterella atlantica]KJH71606.1 16S rRNA processing protein RimM [Aliterella atlantica CENA595]
MSKSKPSSKLTLQNSKLPAGWLQIGKIVAPQGLRGEVRVYPDSDFPERFESPGTRWLWRGGEEPQPIELVSGRYIEGKGLYVLKLAGIDDCDRAEALRGWFLLVPESDRPTSLSEDEYHVLDLIGLEVFNQLTQTVVGKVVDIIPAGNDLLEVQLDSQAKTVLIPFVHAIAPVVDLEIGRIEIVPPPGLLELGKE